MVPQSVFSPKGPFEEEEEKIILLRTLCGDHLGGAPIKGSGAEEWECLWMDKELTKNQPNQI